MKRRSRPLAVVFLSLISPVFLMASCAGTSVTQKNPCAAKAAGSSANPCAAKNPCAAANPCAANPCGAGATGAKAIMLSGEIGRVDGSAAKIIVKHPEGQLELKVGPRTIVRQGAKVTSIKHLKPGDRVTVSYVDTGKEHTLWYVYAASPMTMANPCGGNPCAANPCAAKNPCAANPCAAKNPCAVTNPCAAKIPCAANPCGAKNPCRGR